MTTGSGSFKILGCFEPYGFAMRLVFPAIQENASAFQVLPQFMEVTGNKIDKGAEIQD